MKDSNYEVKFIDSSLNEELKKLKNGTSEQQKLYENIVNSISKLREDPLHSIIIKKKQIPKIYVKKYNVDNLRMLKIDPSWRLIYTIVSNEVKIISVVLEWMNHKDYEKRFNYKVK